MLANQDGFAIDNGPDAFAWNLCDILCALQLAPFDFGNDGLCDWVG